jgi:SAM-dependent methyltransferase
MNSSPTAAAPPDLANILSQDDYLRQRLRPQVGDLDFIVHQDLLEMVLLLCGPLQGRLLDYGCGGSPYARVLPQFAPYVRADITAGEGIDHVLDARGNLPREPDASYDVILSTQVLEHVADPERYLAEAFRLLRPGGSLVLTTHGFFPEHGCPYDFHRWTGYGLEHAVTQAGFTVAESYKLTTGLRASLYLLHFTVLFEFNRPGGGLGHFLLRSARGVYRRIGISLVNRLGHWTKAGARASSHADELHLYLGVALRATKPPGTARP